MKRTDPDIIPTEGIFAVAYHITRHGHITTDKAAELAGCTITNVRTMLNNASRVAPITRAAPGHWIATDAAAELAEETAPLLRTLREELARTSPGTAFCHALTRKQVVTLVRVLESLPKRK